MKFTFNAYHFMIGFIVVAQCVSKFAYDKIIDFTEVWLMLILFALVDMLKILNKK